MSDDEVDKRPLCKYGSLCYRKQQLHLDKFKHPKRKNEVSYGNEIKKYKCDKPEESQEIEMKQKDNLEKDVIGSEERNDKEVSDIGKKDLDQKDVSDSEEIDEKKVSDREKEEVDETKVSIIEKNEHEPLPSDIPKRIESVYLVKMPDDFFDFYEFCKSLNKANPLKALEPVDIILSGPFDLIDKDVKDFSVEEGLRHCRYFFDPPEFQTILICRDKNQLHYGYFRDDPKEMPVFVASNEAKVGCRINIVAGNLFGAMNKHIEKIKLTANPFMKINISKIQHSLIEWAKKNNYNMDAVTDAVKRRRSKIVAKTFHGAGIVVPFNKKTELGYRELSESDKDLKKILEGICEAKSEDLRKNGFNKLYPIIRNATIANDEFDFGTGLELGIDLFCFGNSVLNRTLLQILPTSYELLGRNEFATILRAHIENRSTDNVRTINI